MMQSDTGTSLGFDVADMIGGLPPALSGGLASGIADGIARNMGVIAGGAPRQNRRLPERILVAAHQACDLGDLDVAAQLLSILEGVLGQSRGSADPARRRTMESLIAAHQRLWHLRHAEAAAAPAAASVYGFHEAADPGSFG